MSAKERLGEALRPDAWLTRFELTAEEIAQMREAKHLMPDVAISSQINVIASKPGVGKTTILTHECAKAVRAGYSVNYVNLDCGAGDVKHWSELAHRSGYRLITPHFQGGRGVDEFVAGLGQWAEAGADLGEQVLVIDTLKKISDLMNKSRVKQTMSVLRSLTAKGMTVVCAAHVNKHLGQDGKPIFEGVGDIEADCDNLLYLESDKPEGGNKIVTVYPSDKVRGVFSRRSWEICPDRTVRELNEAVDVSARIEAERQQEIDATAVDVITAGIEAGHHRRKDLFTYAQEAGLAKGTFDRVLRTYTQGKTTAKTTAKWRNEPRFQNNSAYYVLTASAHSGTPGIRE